MFQGVIEVLTTREVTQQENRDGGGRFILESGQYQVKPYTVKLSSGSTGPNRYVLKDLSDGTVWHINQDVLRKIFDEKNIKIISTT